MFCSAGRVFTTEAPGKHRGILVLVQIVAASFSWAKLWLFNHSNSKNLQSQRGKTGPRVAYQSMYLYISITASNHLPESDSQVLGSRDDVTSSVTRAPAYILIVPVSDCLQIQLTTESAT